MRWICFLFAEIVITVTFSSRVHALNNLSRDQFLRSAVFSAVGSKFTGVSGSGDLPAPSQVTLPLLFLPIGGCLALSIVLDNSFRYYAIVDTGSPFLTAPDSALDYSVDASEQYPMTNEQYGQTIGGMQWRESRLSSGTSGLAISNMLLGVPPSNVIAETGGIFCGLVVQDDARPTVLQQWGYPSFSLDYKERELLLSQSALLPEKDDKNIFPIYDLTRFGPNLHHFAVECQQVTLQTPRGQVQLKGLKRPVVVVLDSGLTGCIFSDSWLEDLPIEIGDIQGAQLQVGSTTLTSKPEHWYASCFRLPWFTSEADHPHIIAAGATFLNGMKLTVDSQSKRLQLE
jgi:hypothetical protein